MLRIEDRALLLLPLITERESRALRPIAAPIARQRGPDSGIASLSRAVRAPWQDLYRNRFRQSARDAHDRVLRLGNKATSVDRVLAKIHDAGAQTVGLMQRIRYGRTVPGRLG